MSLILGSRGLIYFVHQFEPTFKEASLLADTELLEAVTSIIRRVIASLVSTAHRYKLYCNRSRVCIIVVDRSADQSPL